MSKAKELLEQLSESIDDYNGLWSEFEMKFPKVAKALKKGDMRDRFFDGINSVSEISASGSKYLFVETPSHGWIVDMKGEVVGEEDGGFDDEKLNKDLSSVFKKKKYIIEQLTENKSKLAKQAMNNLLIIGKSRLSGDKPAIRDLESKLKEIRTLIVGGS